MERHQQLFTERDSYVETQRQQQYNRQLQIIVDGFVDSDQCWALLDEWDVDDDGRVDPDEYVEFARNLVPNVLPDSTDTYDDLPEAYMAAFEATACLCRNSLAGGNPDDTECCVGDNAHIRIPVAPSQSPNSTEVNYLYTACSLTTGAAEIVANSEAPAATETPVAAPVTPTLAPTTRVPTLAPTAPPTLAPTVPPTAAPNDAPTVSPTAAPTDAPTRTPTPTTETKSPTQLRERVFSLTVYDVALRDGRLLFAEDDSWTQEYLSNLIAALDFVAHDVADKLDNVTFVPATQIDRLDDMECPTDVATDTIDSDTTLCQQVTQEVRLDVFSEQDQWTFEAELEQAILNGALQEQLDDTTKFAWVEAGGTNPVTVLTGLEDNTDDTSGTERSVESDTLGSGAITGITLAALFVTLLPIGYYIFQRNQPLESDKPAYQEYDGVDDHSRDYNKRNSNVSDDSGSLKTDMAQGGGVGGAVVGATTLGAATADYGKSNELGGYILEDDDDDEASSSNAGSSGWSSSAGISSLNTGSIDNDNLSHGDAAMIGAATLAGIGVASAFSRSGNAAAATPR